MHHSLRISQIILRTNLTTMTLMLSANALRCPIVFKSVRQCQPRLAGSQPRRNVARAGSDSENPPATQSIDDTLSALDFLTTPPEAKRDEAAIKVAEIRQNKGPAIMPREDTGATASRAATKPIAPASQRKKEMTSQDIAGYAEMLNGRFAMLGFSALVLKEVGSGDSFWGQLASGGGGSAILVIVAVLAASFAPAVTGSVDIRTALNDVEPPRELGPFRKALERTAGRAAMMGIAGVALLELVMSGAFFT